MTDGLMFTYPFTGLCYNATPQVTFQPLAELRIWHAAFHGPPARLGSIHYPPLYHFCLFTHIPAPDPVPPHISCFRYSSCFMFPAPIPVPNPKPWTLNPVPFYFASRPLILVLLLCFSAWTHAHFPQPCYVPFNTYTSITPCMFLRLKSI